MVFWKVIWRAGKKACFEGVKHGFEKQCFFLYGFYSR